jgi:hypothetical protein
MGNPLRWHANAALLDRVRIAAVLVPEGFANDANPGASALLALVRSRGVVVRTIAEGEPWAVGSTRFAIRHSPRRWNLDAPDNARSVVLDGGEEGLSRG